VLTNLHNILQKMSLPRPVVNVNICRLICEEFIFNISWIDWIWSRFP